MKSSLEKGFCGSDHRTDVLLQYFYEPEDGTLTLNQEGTGYTSSFILSYYPKEVSTVLVHGKIRKVLKSR